jgi:hypothetical protein
MAETVSIVSQLDDKPLAADAKAKVQTALKKTLAAEIIPTVGGVGGTHHWSSTHISVVFDKA